MQHVTIESMHLEVRREQHDAHRGADGRARHAERGGEPPARRRVGRAEADAEGRLGVHEDALARETQNTKHNGAAGGRR